MVSLKNLMSRIEEDGLLPTIFRVDGEQIAVDDSDFKASWEAAFYHLSYIQEYLGLRAPSYEDMEVDGAGVEWIEDGAVF